MPQGSILLERVRDCASLLGFKLNEKFTERSALLTAQFVPSKLSILLTHAHLSPMSRYSKNSKH